MDNSCSIRLFILVSLRIRAPGCLRDGDGVTHLRTGICLFGRFTRGFLIRGSKASCERRLQKTLRRCRGVVEAWGVF